MQPSLIQRAAAGMRGLFSVNGTDGPGAGVAVLPQGTTPAARGTYDLLTAYSEIPWLRAVVERIARGVAEVEWRLLLPTTERGRREMRALDRGASRRERRQGIAKLMDAGDMREIESHPFLASWHKPNALLDGNMSRMLTALWLDLGGDCGWLLERNVAGMPIAWWPLRPDWILSAPTASEPGWRVNLPNWSGTIPASEVIFFRNVNPADPYGRGSAMARALSDELEIDEHAAKMLKTLVANRGRPDVLVYGEDLKSATRPQIAELELGWRQRAGSVIGSLRPFFMRLKDIQIKEWSQTLESMQFSEIRTQQRDVVIHVFGVPAEIFGITENSNRSTIDVADFMFQKYVVTPRVQMIRQVIQERLLPLYDERLIFDFESPIAEDREFALKAAQAQPAAPTVDEWRALQGLDHHEDEQSGKAHLVPFSTEPRADLRPAEKLDPFAVPEVPEVPAASAELEEPESEESRSIRAGIARAVRAGNVHPHVHIGLTKRRAMHKLKVRGYSAKDLVALIHAIADKVAPGLSRALYAALNSGRESVDLSSVIGNLSAGQVSQLVTALPFSDLDAKIQEAASDMRRALLRAGEITAQILSDQTGGTVEFDAQQAAVAKWLGTTTAGLAGAMVLSGRKSVERTAAEFVSGKLAAPADAVAALIREQVALDQQRGSALRTFLDELVDEQIPGDQLAPSLARAADALRKGRAAFAGADEAMAAANNGRYQAWTQAIDSGKVPETAERSWLTSDDASVCPICDPMDGETVGVTEMYYSPYSGQHYRSPGPPPDGPHEHDRCGELLVF